jgi:hypothetical protein
MTSILRVDLRRASLPELVTFVFDHPTRGGKSQALEWYWRKDYRLQIDPARQILNLRDLFRKSAPLRRDFSEGELDAGFWFMFGPGGREWFLDPLWNPAVPWPLREEYHSNIPRLYTGVFRKRVGTISYMLWDLLTEDYRFGHRDPRSAPEARRVHQAMYRALGRQLKLRYHEAQFAAIHGLAHLGGPKARALLREYLRMRDRPRRLASYAQAALSGNVL